MGETFALNLGGSFSQALHCLQRLSGCVLLPSTIWIASCFVFMLRLSFCWWGVVEKRENKSKHIYVIIGCSVSLESLFCASAWHSGYPIATPQINWAGLRLLSQMPTVDHFFISV